MKNCLIAASGLGDYWVYEIFKVDDEFDASTLAWELACDQYESYVGLHGIRDISEIMEEENCDENDAYEIFQDERENWLDYWYSFDIENKINQLLEEGLISSITEINNYESLRN